MKRIISVFLALCMVFSAFLDFYPKSAFATENYEGTYWVMSEQEALGFIAFIYNTGKVTEEMKQAGNVYAFLTGQYERGSLEEIAAKISFLATAESNINQCIDNYSAVMDDAYNSLLDYLMKQANGDIDDGLANSTLNSIKDSIKSIILTLGDADEAVLQDIEYIADAYSGITSIKGKVEKLKAGLDAFHYVWASASSAPYRYIKKYIGNLAARDFLSDVNGVSDVADWVDNSLNQSIDGGNFPTDVVLFYNNDNKVQQVQAYGRYIYYVTKSLQGDNSGAFGHCPKAKCYYRGHTYQVFDEGYNWYAAKEYCENIGGHLVTVSSNEENDYITQLLQLAKKNSYWMGGYKNNNQWKWVTNESFTYTHWASRQPDNAGASGGEDVLQIYRKTNPLKAGNTLGYWNDLNHNGTCGSEPFFGLENIGFVCEWDYYLDMNPEAIDEHHYIETVVEPSCEKDGYVSHKCSDCGLEYLTDRQLALGHIYSFTKTVAPTCTADGYDLYTCSRCNATEKRNIASKLGHSYLLTSTTAATCTAKGYDLYTCSRCNTTQRQNEKAALGHNYEVTQDTQATCTEAGVKIEVCTRCNDTKQTDTAATGHQYTKEYIPATCTEQGYTINTCSRCADTYHDSYIAARGHDYGQNGGNEYISSVYNANGLVNTTSAVASFRGEYASVSTDVQRSGWGTRVHYPNEIRMKKENISFENYPLTAKNVTFIGGGRITAVFAYDNSTGREALQSALPYTDADGNLINMRYVDYETADGWVTGRFTQTEDGLADESGNALAVEYTATRPHVVYTMQEAKTAGIMNEDGTVNVTANLINSTSDTAISFATGIDGIYLDMDELISNRNGINFNPFNIDQSRTPEPGIYTISLGFFNASLTGYGSLKIKIYDDAALNEISEESTLTHLIINHTCIDCGEVYTEEEDIDNSALVAAEQKISQYADGDYSAESLSALREIGQQYNYLTVTPAHQAEYDTATAEILTAIAELDPYLNFTVTSENGTVEVTVDAVSKTGNVYSVLFGNEITVTATPDEGYTFAGWYETTSKRLFSADSAYTFSITSNTKLEAKFVKANSATLYFKNGSGYIKASVNKTADEWQTVTAIADLLPELPYAYGKTNGRWEYDEAAVLAALRSGEDADIIAVYDSGEATLPSIPTPTDDSPALTLTYSLDADNDVGTFIMAAGIPEGCTVESIGIAFYYKKSASFDPTNFDVNINNKMLTSKFEASNTSDYYTVDVKKFTNKYNWAVRGYVTYYENDNLKTAYTNQINIVNREQV